MKLNNLCLLVSAALVLTTGFAMEGFAQQIVMKIYSDENYLDDRINQRWLNNYLLWIGYNKEDRVGTDSNKVFIDSLNVYAGKYALHWHCVDAPNPRMWFILFHTNYPAAHDPLDATSTDKVTFWVKAKSNSKPFWFWVEDASYAGDAGQTARITIDGATVFDNGKVVKDEPWNGQWQFVSLPWSLLTSNDTAYVSHTFPGSMTRTISNFNRAIVRQLQFDSNVSTLVPRPPIGQGYITDYYVDEVYFVGGTTGVGGEEKIPVLFDLHQNYPNPFNQTTEIRYDIPTYVPQGGITLKIYDMLGQEVRTLIDHQFANPGSYTVRWDGKDNAGRAVASGEYLYQLQASHYTDTKKMLLIK